MHVGTSAIQEVEMDEDADKPNANSNTKVTPGSTGSTGDKSTDNEAAPASSAALKSRWATGGREADGDAEGSGDDGPGSSRARKRSKTQAATSDADAAILEELSSALASADNKGETGATQYERVVHVAALRAVVRKRARSMHGLYTDATISQRQPNAHVAEIMKPCRY